VSTPSNAGPPQSPQSPQSPQPPIGQPQPGQPYQPPPGDPRFASTYDPAGTSTQPGYPATDGSVGDGSAAAGSAQPPSDTPSESADRPRPVGFDPKGHVKRGRVSAVWVGLIAAAVVLILLIIFIAQNQDRAAIHFLGFSGHMAVGLTILIAAIVGLLLAAIPGSIRILQLRHALKTNTPKDQRVGDGRGRS
jgi:uncharacterized integral membrane protein